MAVYQAIYRKWRPQSFADVVGQAHVTDTLQTELVTGRVAHAYLFCGTRGTGKTTTAKILSRAMNCEALLPNGNPCNKCTSCQGILSGTVMDVIEVDAASNNGVDHIRDLRDEMSYTPAHIKYKVYIIDEVHMLSTGAFNALLKTLEEPPAHVIFILATTEPHKIPATIQSRCQRFDFRRISVANIAGRVGEIARKDGISITQDAIRLVAELGDGSMRDALSVLDLCGGISGEITRQDIEEIAGVTGIQTLFGIAQAVCMGNVSDAITLVSQAVDKGRDAVQMPTELLSLFRDLLVCKLVDDPSGVTDKSPEELQQYKQLVEQMPTEALLHAVQTLAQTAAASKYAQHPQAMLEAALVKLCRPETDATSEAFAARLARLEAGMMVQRPTGMQPALQTVAPTPSQHVALAKEESKPATPPQVAQQIEPIPPQAVEQVAEPATPPQAVQQAEPIPPQVVEQVAESITPPQAVDQTVEPVTPPQVVEQAAEPITPPQASAAPSFEDFSQILANIRTLNPPLFALLQGAAFEWRNEVPYFVFENNILRDTAKTNPAFIETLKQVLKTDVVKLVVAGEQAKQEQEKDPLDELLALSDTMDQMTIF